MNALSDPKALAKALRNDVAAHGLKLSHSQCLEIVAHQLGHADWNTAAAALAGDSFGPLQLPMGGRWPGQMPPITELAWIRMRIDDAVGRNIRFDNIEDRRSDGVLQGTQDWTKRHIVLDVPEDADTLHYGFYLRGEGQCWSRGFDLREVDDSVPVTSDAKEVLDQPMNLNLAEQSVMA